jgi:hypothetical protein
VTTRKLLAVTFVIAVVLFWMRAFGLFELTFDSYEFRCGFAEIFSWAKPTSRSPDPFGSSGRHNGWHFVGLLSAALVIAVAIVASIYICVFAVCMAWWDNEEEKHTGPVSVESDGDAINPLAHEQTK